MATLFQIRNKVRVDISQEDSGNSDYTDSQLNGIINEAQRYIGAIIKKPTDHVDVQVEQGKEGYTLPADAILLIDAYFGDKNITGDKLPMTIMVEEAAKVVNPFWLDNTAQSQGRPLRAFLSDTQTVIIDPKPDAVNSATGKILTVNYCFQPAIMSADGDTPQIPIAFHDLLANYTQSVCFMGKLKKIPEGQAIYAQLEGKAKRLESLATQEQLNSGFYWGTSVGDDDSILRTGNLYIP